MKKNREEDERQKEQNHHHEQQSPRTCLVGCDVYWFEISLHFTNDVTLRVIREIVVSIVGHVVSL